MVGSRSGRSVTAARSALARHVGPPRPAPPAPAEPSARPAGQQAPLALRSADDVSQRDTEVLVRPAAPARPPEVAAAPAVTSTAVTVDGSTSAGPRRAPLTSVAGAALAVCLVVLGISALLWAQPGPPPPSEPVGIAEQEQGAGTAGQAAGSSALGPSTPAAPARPAATPPASASASAPTAAAAALPPVTVLNNSRIDGLAARAAARFQAAGWPVAETGNYRGRLSLTTVFHEPGQEAAARQLAARFPGVVRVLPRPARLPGSGLTVVLTRDFE